MTKRMLPAAQSPKLVLMCSITIKLHERTDLALALTFHFIGLFENLKENIHPKIYCRIK